MWQHCPFALTTMIRWNIKARPQNIFTALCKRLAHKSRDWRLQRKRHCEKGCISGNNNGDCGEEGIRKVAFQGIGRFLYVTRSLDHILTRMEDGKEEAFLERLHFRLFKVAIQNHLCKGKGNQLDCTDNNTTSNIQGNQTNRFRFQLLFFWFWSFRLKKFY